MIYLFKTIVFNCRQATLLSVKRDQGTITLFERAKLAYHLLYCDPCRRFIKQSQLLDRAARQLDEVLSSQPPYILSDTTKSRMQETIDSV